jgi:hypothetical protein
MLALIDIQKTCWDSPILLAPAADLLHTVHALIVGDQVIFVTFVDLVVAFAYLSQIEVQ